MMKEIIFTAIMTAMISVSVPLVGADEEVAQLSLLDSDRLLIIAPHPDDETISSAGVIQEAVRRKIPVRVLYITNGDSNQLAFLYYRKRPVFGQKQAVAMGELRQKEAISAMQSLGLTDDQLIFLGYPDYGTLNVFKRVWRTDRFYQGVLTRASAVPYKLSQTPGAPYSGESMLADIKKAFLDFKPTKIIVNHPADRNSDHQAAYLFTRVALWDLNDQLNDVELYAYMIHGLGWPRPLGLYPERRLLPYGSLYLRPQDVLTYDLDSSQIENKKLAVRFYNSQIPYKPKYLFTFVRANELFLRVSDISLKGQILSGEVWEGLDGEQQLRTRDPHRSYLRAVVYALEKEKLVVKIKLNQWSRLGFDINLYLLGYKNGTDFKDMPKIRVRLTNDHQAEVFDGRKRLRVSGVNVRRLGNDFYVDVPLDVLGHPDRIISSSTVRIRNLPEESSVWTILRLNDV